MTTPEFTEGPMRHHRAMVLLSVLITFSGMSCGNGRGYGAPEMIYAELDSASCETIPAQAAGILQSNCAVCHGETSPGKGGINYITDLVAVVSSGLVIPGDPDDSKLVKVVLDGYMPDDPLPDLSLEDQAVLKQWVACGAEPDVTEERTFVSPSDVNSALVTDLEGALTATDRGFARYISLVHLYNAGAAADELRAYRSAIDKLLLSLSWEEPLEAADGDTGEIPYPGHLEVVPIEVEDLPEEIAEIGLLYRIDLRDYGWDINSRRQFVANRRGVDVNDLAALTSASEYVDADAWEYLAALYPYAVYEQTDLAIQSIRDYTGTGIPIMNGDWLVANGSQPPLYFAILQLPDDFDTFLEDFGVSVERPDGTGPPRNNWQCAGFEASGVSLFNRVICGIDRSEDQYCWVSFDHGSSLTVDDKKHNIFQNPLDFTEDGGEMFCTLPNHQQAYLVVKATGDVLERGPAQVVNDPARRPDANGDTVATGLSCMQCHDQGVLYKSDEVQSAVSQLDFLYESIQTEVLNIYRQEDMDLLQEWHATLFQERAMAPIGVSTDEPEPVSRLVRNFEGKMNLRRVAAELGQSEEELKVKLTNLAEARADSDDNGVLQVPQLLTGDLVDRAVFEAVAPLLIEGLYGAYSGTDGCGVSQIPCQEGFVCAAHDLRYNDDDDKEGQNPAADAIDAGGGLKLCVPSGDGYGWDTGG